MSEDWHGLNSISPHSYTCGFCGRFVGVSLGYFSNKNKDRIYICAACRRPSYFQGDKQVPGAPHGREVGNLPTDIEALYQEARNSFTVNAFTASVLACRKLLMNIAVARGASEGKKFIEYVEFLSEKGFVPPDGKGWVDHIREKGNDATHEIKIMSRPDAEDLITFSEMLLKFIFEFPSRVPKKSQSAPTK